MLPGSAWLDSRGRLSLRDGATPVSLAKDERHNGRNT